jgi:putative redox protein
MSNESPAGVVTARISGDSYATRVEAGPHALVADMATDHGGTGTGPGPFDLLLAALTSCVLMTIRMYAARKGWPLTGAMLVAEPTRREGSPLERVRLILTLDGPLDGEQRARLLDIASRCPVHRTLQQSTPILIEAAGA